MNISINYKYIISLLILAASFSLQSCSDDDSHNIKGSKQNIVFINMQEWSPVDVDNSSLFNSIKTPTGSFLIGANKIETTFTVRCTQAATQDIVVKLESDNSLVIDGYEVFPSGVTIKMDKNELTIPKGATIANGEVTVSIDLDKLGLLDPGAFMAPIRIVSASNATLSNEYNSASLLIKNTYTNCKNNATGITGIAANKTGWRATANEATDLGNDLFDNMNSTYHNAMSFPFTLEFDLGSVHTDIAGFAMNYTSINYGMAVAKIYTSETGTNNYELHGSTTFPRAAIQYLNFYGKVNARYIKIEVVSPYATRYGTRITEFNVYQD